MRMGQKNRMRGRNNNRRGPNPLTRSFESNGPDVKVRGTAAHIAEKYVQLARDAHSSGDVVMTESYLQHAEHYYRLIAAAQAQSQTPYANQTAQQQADIDMMEDEDEFEVAGADRFTFRPPQAFQVNANGTGQTGYGQNGQPYSDQPGGEQPVIQGEQPFVGEQPPVRQEARHDGRGEGRYENRPDGRQGEARQQDGRQERFGNRGPFGDRRDRFRNRDRDRRPGEGGAPQQFDRPRPPMADPAAEPQPELPSFITAPVLVQPRVIVAEPMPAPDLEPAAAVSGPEEEGGRSRRRRRPRPRFEGEAAPAVEGPGDGE